MLCCGRYVAHDWAMADLAEGELDAAATRMHLAHCGFNSDVLAAVAADDAVLAQCVRAKTRDCGAASVEGLKLLKAAASDFAFQRYPDGDTYRLTAAVARLVDARGWRRQFRSLGVARMDELAALAAHVSRVAGIRTAAMKLLAPVFEQVTRESEQQLDVPALLNRLAPGPLHQLSHAERVERLDAALRAQHNVAVTHGVADADDGSTIVTVAVRRGGGDPGCTVVELLPGPPAANEDAAQAVWEAAVVAEARRLVEAMRPKSAQQESGGATTISATTRATVSMDALPDADRTALLHFLYRRFKAALRFKEPLASALHDRGVLEPALAHDGWLPLHAVADALHAAVAATTMPAARLDGLGVETLVGFVETDDLFHRFQIGSPSDDSPFAGQLCGRAVSGHERTAPGAKAPLFQLVLQQWTLLTAPMCEGAPTRWIHIDKKDLRGLARSGFKFYDAMAFATALSLEAVHAVAKYLALPASERIDDRTKPSMLFVECNVAAAVHDCNLDVRLEPPGMRPATHQHVAITPHEAYSRREATPSDAPDGSVSERRVRYLPLPYLTGRVAELTQGSEQVVITSTVVPRDPTHCRLPPTARDALGRAACAEGHQRAPEAPRPAQLPQQVLHGGRVPSSPILAVPLDTTALKRALTDFASDTTRVKMVLSVPKLDGRGVGFLNRTGSLADLKAHMGDLDLKYSLTRSSAQPSPAAACVDDFLVSKRQLCETDLLRDVQTELGYTFASEALLQHAVTQEHVNREANYERLEFIGDAVLDYVVAHDAAAVPTVPLERVQQAVVDLCQNGVLCWLLPPSLERRVLLEFGTGVWLEKTCADFVEAIVGAVYMDGAGLDGVRAVVRRLFARLPHRWDALRARKAGGDVVVATDAAAADVATFDVTVHMSDDHVTKLERAVSSCFYNQPAATPHLCLFHCTTLVTVVAPTAQHLADPGAYGPHAGKLNFNTHLATSGLPRVMDKAHATHFTTGPQYSYRAVERNEDMFQRILAVIEAQETAVGGAATSLSVPFVNEVITPWTHLVFDIDGCAIVFAGLLRHLRDWYVRRYRATAEGYLLSCTGMSVVKKAIKHSYHVHFPGIPLTLDELRVETASLTQFVVQRVQREAYSAPAERRRGEMVVVALPSAGDHADGAAPRLVAGRVLFSSTQADRERHTRRRTEFLRLSHAAERAFNSTVPFQRLTGIWRDVLQFLGPVDAFRGFAHTCLIARIRAVEAFAHTPPQPAYCIVRCLQAPVFASFGDAASASATSLRLDAAACTPIQSAADVAALCEQASADVIAGRSSDEDRQPCSRTARRKLTIAPSDYWERTMKAYVEADVYGPGFWTKVIDTGLPESAKLRMYMNDKFDLKYGVEGRPVRLMAVIAGHKRDRNPAASRVSADMLRLVERVVPYCDTARLTCLAGIVPATVVPRHMPPPSPEDAWGPAWHTHEQILRATALRSDSFFDLDGCEHFELAADAERCRGRFLRWDPDADTAAEDDGTPADDIPDCGTMQDGSGSHSTPQIPTERLPDFASVRGAVTAAGYDVLIPNLLSMQPLPADDPAPGAAAPLKFSALRPTSWRWDATRGVASFHIGDAVVITAAATTFAAALNDDEVPDDAAAGAADRGSRCGAGMRRLFELLLPHCTMPAYYGGVPAHVKGDYWDTTDGEQRLRGATKAVPAAAVPRPSLVPDTPSAEPEPPAPCEVAATPPDDDAADGHDDSAAATADAGTAPQAPQRRRAPKNALGWRGPPTYVGKLRSRTRRVVYLDNGVAAAAPMPPADIDGLIASVATLCLGTTTAHGMWACASVATLQRLRCAGVRDAWVYGSFPRPTVCADLPSSQLRRGPRAPLPPAAHGVVVLLEPIGVEPTTLLKALLHCEDGGLVVVPNAAVAECLAEVLGNPCGMW